MTTSHGASPQIPVSWGELIDRITILEIKSERFSREAALANVRSELAVLQDIADPVLILKPILRAAKSHLRSVNERLWDIEDRLREKERAGDFGAEFVELARSVYTDNDERAALKRYINDVVPCGIVEEKDYSGQPPAARSMS